MKDFGVGEEVGSIVTDEEVKDVWRFAAIGIVSWFVGMDDCELFVEKEVE